MTRFFPLGFDVFEPVGDTADETSVIGAHDAAIEMHMFFVLIEMFLKA